MKKMTIFRIIWAFFFVTACVPAPAAQKQYKVQIVDAETAAPIAHATIDLHYFPSTPAAADPVHPQVTANAQGELTIQSKAEPVIWQVQADTYLEQQLSTRDGTLPPRYTPHATANYDGIIHLYQKPEPQLIILISDIYTGLLTINLQPAPGFDYVLVDDLNLAFAAIDPQASYIQEVAGMRVFTATASAEGVVDLVVTPLLYDIEAHELQIQNSTGVLPYYDIADPQNTERGIWGNVNEDDKRLNQQIQLFVGTRHEYQEFQQ